MVPTWGYLVSAANQRLRRPRSAYQRGSEVQARCSPGLFDLSQRRESSYLLRERGKTGEKPGGYLWKRKRENLSTYSIRSGAKRRNGGEKLRR